MMTRKMRDTGIKSFQLAGDGPFPNNPQWQLLIYPAALSFSGEDPAGELEALFEKNGWGRAWRNGIYAFHHFHSNAHEVLGIFRGRVRVQFGGPQGVKLELTAGDVAVLPAGTAHRNLKSSADLGVVGAYPPGDEYDLLRGKEEELPRAVANIRQVRKPAKDPVFGTAGGLCEHW
jgi:uncharacterized protein YjlB